ncbi:aldehyde dehydrogenase family protein [Sporichthya brevicatena]|uniref:Aldehyde dehydrogenase family protein n=1 Tax=Sporichthya brevicatena TaxID=171442 RepID=A0ABN1GQT9_9ACTN
MAAAAPDLRVFDGLYVDGRWVPTANSEPVLNPATEAAIATAPVGGTAETDLALAAARRAFDTGPWPQLTPRQRGAALERLLGVFTDWADAIADVVIDEVGTSAMTARRAQVDTPLRHLEWFVEHLHGWRPETPLPATTITGRHGRVLGSGVLRREPIGVVSAITPFNAPFFLNVMKLAPALAAGCTLVLKPSPYTPLEALLIAKAAEEAELPPGVLNVVTGGLEVAQQLTTDPRVDAVTFTGSDAVGEQILVQAAPTMKRVLLELGGKSAMIVLPEADLAQAVAGGVAQAATFSGQGCALWTRHLVHRSRFDEYVGMLAGGLDKVTVGDPRDPSTVMGPLIRESQRARVESYVELARSGGGEVVAGGTRPEGLDRGFYYRPTLVTGLDNSSPVAQDEIFGPVLVAIPFDTDDEAVAIANDSKYGLSGAVFGDPARAYDLACRLRTGNVSINGGTGGMSPWAPFGGWRRSGLGRELGEGALDEFTELKTVQWHAG